MSTESTIDVRDFVPQITRQVQLPNGNTYPALWMNEITIDDLNAMVAEEQSTTGLDRFAMDKRHIKKLMPSISDDDLASLTIRQIPALSAALKKFERQAEDDDRPLESAPASSAPEASSL